MPKKYKSSISFSKSVKSSKICCKVTYESNQNDYTQLFELFNSIGPGSHKNGKKFNATITRRTNSKYEDEDDIPEDEDAYLECLSKDESIDSASGKVEITMVEPTELLEKHDNYGYRIIWCCYKYESSIDNKLYHERIRLHEEINLSRQVTKDSDAKLMYKKFRKTVCSMTFKYPMQSREQSKLESVVKTLFKKRVLFSNRHSEVTSIAYDFIRSIVGEKKQSKILLCVMNTIMQAIVDMRNSVYKVIRDLTVKVTKRNIDKQFIALLQKPYRDHESGYQLFLRKLIIYHEVCKQAAKHMNEIFDYLTHESHELRNMFDFESIIKVCFYTVIYENILVKESLGVVDSHCSSMPATIYSNYDSSSDDVSAPCQTIEYDRGAFHNYYAISESEKSQCILFFTIIKIIDSKDIQLTFREQPISDCYKLMLSGIHTDPFGELHEKRRDTEVNEVSNFVFSPYSDNSDTTHSYKKQLELYAQKQYYDDPHEKFIMTSEDSDEDFNEIMQKKLLNSFCSKNPFTVNKPNDFIYEENVETKPMKKKNSKQGPFMNRQTSNLDSQEKQAKPEPPQPQPKPKPAKTEENMIDKIKDKKRKKRKRKKKRKLAEAKSHNADNDQSKDETVTSATSLGDKLKSSKYKNHYHFCIEKFNAETLMVSDDEFETTVHEFSQLLESIHKTHKSLKSSCGMNSVRYLPNFSSHWVKSMKIKIQNELANY